MSVLMSHDKCSTTCCDTDFCNNRCGVSVLNDTNTSWSPSSSTAGISTTVTTPMTSQTTGALLPKLYLINYFYNSNMLLLTFAIM
jgi:hypothetical protein